MYMTASKDNLTKCIELASKANFTTCAGTLNEVSSHPAYKLIQDTHTLYTVKSENGYPCSKLTVLADKEAQKQLIGTPGFTVTITGDFIPSEAIVRSRLIGFQGCIAYDYHVINYRKCGLIERFNNKHCTIFGTISNYSDETDFDLT